MQKFNKNQTLPAVACATAMVASLAACSGAVTKAALPGNTGGSRPSTAAIAPALLAAHSTNAHGGLKLVVNLPAHLSSPSRPRMRLFSVFLQSVGQTMARNKLDPAVSRLASASVAKSIQALTVKGSARAIGSVIFTVSKVQTGTSGVAVISGCVDQSKVVQVRKDGSHDVAEDVKKHPTRKMTATVHPGKSGQEVTAFTLAPGACAGPDDRPSTSPGGSGSAVASKSTDLIRRNAPSAHRTESGH